MSGRNRSFIAYGLLVMLATFGPAGIASFTSSILGTKSIKAEQPKSIKQVVQSGGLTIYCEEPSGDKVYTFAPQGGGAAIWVDKGGCK
jgi:hypothetical protein